jgi:hypothetical protein
MLMVGAPNARGYYLTPSAAGIHGYKRPLVALYCRNQAGESVLNPQVLLRWSI